MKILPIGCPWAHQSDRLILPRDFSWVFDRSTNVDAIVFFDDHILNEIPDHIKNIKKYAWISESKSIIPDISKEIKDNFDWFSDTYDIIFSHDREITDLGKNSEFILNPSAVTWIENKQIYPKSKLVSMISSRKMMCEGHKYRLQWVDKLKNDLDLYGRGFNEIKNKEEGLSDYMFSVAIENDSYNTYFTEKIIDCFATGTIPVYYGSPDIGEHFNEDGIIKLDEDFDMNNLSANLYYKKMNAIKENFDIVQKMQLPEDVMFNLIKERKLV